MLPACAFVPTDRPTFEGEIATYWMEDGILVSRSKSPRRTVANLTDNVALVRRTEQLPNVYTAMAMISEPGLARLIMNILFKLQRPPIPMKSFDDEKEAKAWLKQYLPR